MADKFRGDYLLEPGVIGSNKETIEHSSHLREKEETYMITKKQNSK